MARRRWRNTILSQRGRATRNSSLINAATISPPPEGDNEMTLNAPDMFHLKGARIGERPGRVLAHPLSSLRGRKSEDHRGVSRTVTDIAEPTRLTRT